MRSLFRFLLRNYFLMMFLALEAISFVLIVSFNNYQRVTFFNSSNNFAGTVYEKFSSIDDYFSLSRTNARLAAENASLRKQLQFRMSLQEQYPVNRPDTVDAPAYIFTSAKVINNSVNKQFNYITLNKGSRHGIKPDMGIIDASGVVGVITNVSPNYSTGLSLLNKRFSISAQINKNKYAGSLMWDGEHYNTADLKEIPFNVEVSVGDTVVTSSHSGIFPEGIMIGTIIKRDVSSGTNFYNIKVELSTSFKTLKYVEVVQNTKRTELIKLESNNVGE
ncbi:MAG TPA: rod shape-determining protein MreC [Prolixibacteraceae bacterium]|nr:MAG: rod shape-determining protein MreC [Bacteroidetes bacterium GWB2_41_8]HCY42692.1 rod shape-determining protein MreC [Prolixibacteraceae bacterium]